MSDQPTPIIVPGRAGGDPSAQGEVVAPLTVGYPGAVHAFNKPGPTTYRDDPGFELDVLVTQLEEVAEQLQIKLGISASTPAANQVLRGTGAGSSAFGQIQTADLVANAVTQAGMSSAFFAGTTTSASSGPVTNSDVPLTTQANGVVLAWAYASLSHSTAGKFVWLGVNVDGAAPAAEAVTVLVNAAQQLQLAVFYRFAGLSAGAHIFRATWRTDAPTATMYTGLLTALELKK